jgi:hypothetical protein
MCNVTPAPAVSCSSTGGAYWGGNRHSLIPETVSMCAFPRLYDFMTFDTSVQAKRVVDDGMMGCVATGSSCGVDYPIYPVCLGDVSGPVMNRISDIQEGKLCFPLC